jgi:hypothetical protein
VLIHRRCNVVARTVITLGKTLSVRRGLYNYFIRSSFALVSLIVRACVSKLRKQNHCMLPWSVQSSATVGPVLGHSVHKPSPQCRSNLRLPVRTPPVSDEISLSTTPTRQEPYVVRLVLYLAPAWSCSPPFWSPNNRVHTDYLYKAAVAVHSRPANRGFGASPARGLTHSARS